MRKSDGVIFGVVLLLLVGIVGLNFYAKHFIDNSSSLITQKSHVNLLTGAVVGLEGPNVFSSLGISSDVVECWKINSQSNCNNNESSGCKWDSSNSLCVRHGCVDGDGKNQTFCETTLKSFNQSCTWSAGSSSCTPVGGAFFGSKCGDFNNNSQGCFNTKFCIWNSSVSVCLDPVGGVGGQAGGANNPSCSVIVDQSLCNGISGCSWNSGLSSCSGNTGGMSCSLLNKTTCPQLTLLSTCCGWNGTNCTSSFDKGCYNTKALSSGAMFCEDSQVYSNQSKCAELAGSPWYMPCKWDNTTNQCHFNSKSFGDSAKMGEISTESACTAAGGSWKSNSFTNDGTTKTDSWCEFNFGFKRGSGSGSGNCDTACWACETAVSSAKGNTSSQAQSFCENSGLGYCEYRADSNAPNKLGYCNAKNSFIEGGSKSCKSDCGACAFLKSPQSQCQNSTKGCTWSADTNAPNALGYCYGKSEKYCGNDCFSCYDSSTCTANGKGGAGACTWDLSSSFCKPAGFNGEVCFDGKDNDNNGVIDCADPSCSNDKFCGGEDLAVGFNADCPSLTTNASCLTNKCQWSKSLFEDDFGGANAGHCDFPGAQCSLLDDQAPCQNTQGCSWNAAASNTCGKNSSLFNSCFSQTNQSNCELVVGCGWSLDHFNTSRGRCEPLVFSQCMGNETRFQSQTLCQSNITVKGISTQVCGWTVDQFSPNGGRCGPSCFTRSGTNQSCQDMSAGLCAVTSGYCAPKSFGGNCNAADGNKTRCESEFNATCSFFFDTNANNGNTTEKGWCKPKGEAKVFGFMGDIPPTILGNDGNDAAVDDHWDLTNIGLRDDFDNLVLGASVVNFGQSAVCNGTALSNGTIGAGIQNYTFFWYVDSDGNTTNHCSARDNSSQTGFEFSFKYQATWVTSKVERSASFQCVNGSWGPIPVPLFSTPQKMCPLIQGGMAGVKKKDLYKLKDLYNKSKDLRLYTTLGDTTSVVNESRVNDTAGPYYYSPGSFDFKFEDCSDSGADADGDGLTSANDPDCFGFMKFGYMPIESGFQCGDNQDNDADGKTDCADDGCTYEPVCGGSGLPIANVNDKTAPKIVWFQVDSFPDSAHIEYDTNEPANGTLGFYNYDNTCAAANLNATIRDKGLIDGLVPDYRLFHEASIDNFQFNIDKLSSSLVNATAFFYKTTLCDINGNCAVSACLNFTTKASLLACKTCTSSFTFPFSPQSGKVATDPLGSLAFKFEYALGGTSTVDPNAGVGISTNLTQSKYFNLIIENTNATNASRWRFKLINATVSGKVATSVQNFTGGSDIQFNATSNSSSSVPLVGLSTNKCQEIINAFHPAKIELGIPGNKTGELWQCNTGSLTNCTNRASNATVLGYNTTLNMTSWLVPAEWGC